MWTRRALPYRVQRRPGRRRVLGVGRAAGPAGRRTASRCRSSSGLLLACTRARDRPAERRSCTAARCPVAGPDAARSRRPCDRHTDEHARRQLTAADTGPGPILSVFPPALIAHSELKSVHPGFPVAFIFKHKLIDKKCCFQLVCSNLLLLWTDLVHYIIHELLKLCTPKNSLE